MKKILLSSAAIVAFAGAAAADIEFSGSAKLGYNDDHEDGIYADSDIDIKMSQELNNGWTAALTYGLELEKLENDVNNGATAKFDGNLLLSLTNGTYGVYYGDTKHAAESLWNGVSEMAQDGFSEQDKEEVLKVTAMVGEIEVAVSSDITTVGQELNQTSFGAKGSFGSVNFSLGYQSDVAAAADGAKLADYNTADVLGLSVGTSFAGADVTLAFAKSGDESSTGLEVSYPVGPVTVGAFYVKESAAAQEDAYGASAAYADGPIEAKLSYTSVGTGTADDSKTKTKLEGSYAVSDDLKVYAGIIGSNDDAEKGQYIGVTYDLGGGASLLASYADVDESNEGDDEFGAKDYKDGMTVQLSLKF